MERLTLQDNGKIFCIYDMSGDKRSFKISDKLFIEHKEVKELKEVTKNIKERPEFPKKIERYSFIKTSPPGVKKIEILLINELRAEIIDREVLEAIKRGQDIDLS